MRFRDGARAWRTSATRTCASRSRTRSRTRSGRRRPCRRLDLAAGLTLEFHAPDLEAFPLLALAREAGERGGTAPCVFNAANEVAVEAFLEERIRFADIAEIVAAALETLDLSPARDVEELTAADAQTRAFAEGSADPRMSIFVAILGLALLIFIHELGHFDGALAVGMRPRGFSIGFGPPLAKVRRNDIDYAFRASRSAAT